MTTTDAVEPEALSPADVKLARFEQVATDAITRALLYRVSPRSGGLITPDATAARVKREAGKGFTGEELMELLRQVALRAVEDADHQAHSFRSSVVHELDRVAEMSDSLTIHRYAEQLRGVRV